jgi:DNA-binding response OmpR family regulator
MTQQQTNDNKSLKRVIVVESDLFLRKSIIDLLVHEGYTVVGVGSAYDFYHHVFDAPRYAVAIIDSALLDQDGLVVAEYARKNTDMRIITLSAPVSTAGVPAKIKSGADLNLVKPIDNRLLSAYVATLFSRLAS